MQGVASRLATLVPASGTLFVARAGIEVGEAVKKAFQRGARVAKEAERSAGRLVVALADDEHFHVTDLDCLAAADGRSVDAAKVVLALRAPGLPAVRSGRWVGDWKPMPDEDGEQVFRLSHDVRGVTRQRFCAAYGLSEVLFSDGTSFPGLDDPTFLRLWGAVEWWRINELGLAPRMFRGAVIEPIPPAGFVFTDLRRSSSDAA